MALSHSTISLIALIAVVFSLIGSTVADESPAPAPSPMSSAGSLSPSLAAVGCAVAALLFGSFLQI
ncbi:hypothetical protein DCAR_0104810 [Daucus carota subsp. sativus]|uniref:Uncharacterized protein n=1 Tax=Daucus carota subsp. sativus TaxID=79200 RepID=A0AAF1AJL3_DAUCS|nr:hypothetical protein DCAR_0104810 [Daucus carota subsp. sativus]